MTGLGSHSHFKAELGLDSLTWGPLPSTQDSMLQIFPILLCWVELNTFLSFLKRFYLFIFREKGREGEREGEKHQCVVASHVP